WQRFAQVDQRGGEGLQPDGHDGAELPVKRAQQEASVERLEGEVVERVQQGPAEERPQRPADLVAGPRVSTRETAGIARGEGDDRNGDEHADGYGRPAEAVVAARQAHLLQGTARGREE